MRYLEGERSLRFQINNQATNTNS